MNKQRDAHIILVDDNPDFAKEYAESLQNLCQTAVVFATTAEAAIELIKQNPIKVAILDQVMPTKGTELFWQIRKIDPKIKTILLTGEADRHELSEATNIGFDYAILKEDHEMETLPQKILLLIIKYNTDNVVADSKPFYVFNTGGRFRKGYTISYTMLGYEVIESNYIPEDGWKTRNLVERGTTFTLENELDSEKDFSFIQNFQVNTDVGLGIELNKQTDFKFSLAMKMESAFNNTYSEKFKNVVKRKIQIEMPSQSAGVVSRVYEYAKVFTRIKIFLKKICSCCQGTTIDAIEVLVPIPIIKYRLKEYYEDNTIKELKAGELRS